MKERRTRMYRWREKQEVSRQTPPGFGRSQQRKTEFYYRPKANRRLRIGRAALALALAAGLLLGLVRLVIAGAQLFAARRTSSELQQLYQTALPSASSGVQTPEASLPPEVEDAEVHVPALDVSPSPEPMATVVPSPSPTPTATLQPRLNDTAYPNNPQRTVSSRFQDLRAENVDIVGWLSIDKMLSEAVVQRDNIYYLDHDAKGNENVNGALFLDAAVSLKNRPYSLLIYGHNMKSGAMFGNMRHYDSAAYYRAHPLITFDTLYEEGRYVVFAEGIISMTPGDERYIDFFAFTSTRIQERQQMIDTLLACSAFSCPIDVRPDDQLLILVTCVGDDAQRRILAARRVREDEAESVLRAAINRGGT